MNNLSLAIWAKRSSNFEGGRREIHFNIWNINNQHALDIGVMLPRQQFELGESLFIFLPFECQIIDLFDNVVENNNSSLYSIFNCFFDVTNCGNGIQCRSAKIDNEIDFCLTSIDKNLVERDSKGDIFKITPKVHSQCNINNKCKNYYFRFRISGPCIESCYFKSEKESSRFANFTDDISFLDFRYNDRRVLPDNVAHAISEGRLIDLDLIQFFYICHASYKIEQTKKEINNIRCLEKHLWLNYFPGLTKYEHKTSSRMWTKWLDYFGLNKPDAALAYQRKTKNIGDAKLTDFSFLIKLSYQKFRVWKAIGWFSVACLVSFAISFSASMIYDCSFSKQSPAAVAPPKEVGQPNVSKN